MRNARWCRTVAGIVMSAAVALASALTDGELVAQGPLDRVPYELQGLARWKRNFSARQTEAGEELVQCQEIREPKIELEIPLWARGRDMDELLNDPAVEQVLYPKEPFNPTPAFRVRDEFVLKGCTNEALHAIMEIAVVKQEGSAWIYFDCGPTTGKHVIKPWRTLIVGRGGATTTGKFWFVAPNKDVMLHGRQKNRIMQVMRNVEARIYGIEFRQGYQVDTTRNRIDLDNHMSGAAILVSIDALLVCKECSFIKNKAQGLFARRSGGGAVKGESGSMLLFYKCLFRRNRASVGGAIATSSAKILYVSQSSFDGNWAVGAMDGSQNKKGHEKDQILIRGGALRVDSLDEFDDNEVPDEHLVLCNSDFVNNFISFKKGHLTKVYGYSQNDLHRVRAMGAAVTAWNSMANLNLEAGDHHFMTVKGCKFEGNYERIDYTADRTAWFVFEVEGAGHVKMSDTVFRNNNVRKAVAKFDNSNRFDDGTMYDLSLQKITFLNNGPALNLWFHANYHDSVCSFKAVDGMPDGKDDCKDALVEAEKEGEPVEIDEGGDPIIDRVIAASRPALDE